MERKINNGIFYVVISLVAVLGIGGFVLAYSLSNNVEVQSGATYNYYEAAQPLVRLQPSFDEEGNPIVGEPTFGAFPGPDVYSDVNIYGTLTTGSNAYTTTSTSATAATLLLKDLAKYSYIKVVNNKGNLSWTLPATSTMMQLLPRIGSQRTWLIENATTTPNRTITIVTGAGMDLTSDAASSTADVIKSPDWARLTCTQIAYKAVGALGENIHCNIQTMGDAD